MNVLESRCLCRLGATFPRYPMARGHLVTATYVQPLLEVA